MTPPVRPRLRLESVARPGPGAVLTPEMLDAIGARAAAVDRENRFPHEDFDDLRRVGYLAAAVPVERGGLGLSATKIFEEQRRLAYRAPATALAVNMHLFWTCVARDLSQRGDASLEWILDDAARGEVFAAGHSEPGNELTVVFSKTRAEPAEDGYRFTGHKIFTTLTPVWTRLGIYGLHLNHPRGPQIVHGFLRRDQAGYRIRESWDVMGMRGTQSQETILEGAEVPKERIARFVPPGRIDDFNQSMFFWGPGAFANIYAAAAQRIFDLALAGAKKRTSNMLSRTMAYHPEVQHKAADGAIQLAAMWSLVDGLVHDWETSAEHDENWMTRISIAKHFCVEGAKRVSDLALDLSGGSGLYRGNEIERLYRDIRCGTFHPPNDAVTHEIVGKTTLGLDLGEQPRWG